MSEGGDLVFPSVISLSKPLSENAFNVSLRRMGFAREENVSPWLSRDRLDHLKECEFNPDVIEAALAQQHQKVVRRVYNRAGYRKERMALMQAWAISSTSSASSQQTHDSTDPSVDNARSKRGRMLDLRQCPTKPDKARPTQRAQVRQGMPSH